MGAEAVQVCILAGGASRRMGRDKARLEVEGEPLVRALASRLAPHAAGVWIVAKRDSALEDLGWPLVYDEAPDRALVYGIATALRAPGPPWRWLVACDMPRIAPEVLAGLASAARAAAAPGAAVRLPGRADLEPLPSLWHRCLAAEPLETWGLTARDWLRQARLAAWPVPMAMQPLFANLNTPLEWTAFEREEGRSA